MLERAIIAVLVGTLGWMILSPHFRDQLRVEVRCRDGAIYQNVILNPQPVLFERGHKSCKVFPDGYNISGIPAR